MIPLTRDGGRVGVAISIESLLLLNVLVHRMDLALQQCISTRIILPGLLQ